MNLFRASRFKVQLETVYGCFSELRGSHVQSQDLKPRYLGMFSPSKLEQFGAPESGPFGLIVWRP